MKLKDYIEKLQKLVEENPEASEMIIVYYDEGNGYQEVIFGPSFGCFKEGDWYSQEDMQDNNKYYQKYYPDAKINSVCIN